MYSWSLVIFSFDNCLHKHQTSFLDLHCFFNHQARVCKRFFAFQFMMKIILIFNKADRNHQLAVWWHKKIRPNCDVWVDKTQCQLCKRLAEPFIPLSWSCLVSKRVSLWMWSPGGSQQPFSCGLGHFRHGDNNRTNNQVILEQASDKAVFCNFDNVRVYYCDVWWNLSRKEITWSQHDGNPPLLVWHAKVSPPVLKINHDLGLPRCWFVYF